MRIISDFSSLMRQGWPRALKDALNRNQELAIECDKLRECERMADETLEIFDARRVQRAEEALVQLSKWREMEDPDASNKGCWLLEQAIVGFLAKRFHEANGLLVDDLLLACSAESQATRDLYFEYWQFTCVGPNDEKDDAEKRFARFADAVPFLIDGRKVPVTFTAEQQRLMDTFLQSACAQLRWM